MMCGFVVAIKAASWCFFPFRLLAFTMTVSMSFGVSFRFLKGFRWVLGCGSGAFESPLRGSVAAMNHVELLYGTYSLDYQIIFDDMQSQEFPRLRHGDNPCHDLIMYYIDPLRWTHSLDCIHEQVEICVYIPNMLPSSISYLLDCMAVAMSSAGIIFDPLNCIYYHSWTYYIHDQLLKSVYNLSIYTGSISYI